MREEMRLAQAGKAALCMLVVAAVGCGRSSSNTETKGQATGPVAAAKVATIKPMRATVRRTSEQPGQIEAIEVTPMYAKLAGYVRSVSADIGDRVKKGQVMAELRVPEVEAEARRMRAMVDEALAEQKQSEAAVEVARAGVEAARAKVHESRSGLKRSEADANRWRSEFARVDQLHRERALTGSLLDETRSKLQAAEAGLEEVKAHVQSNEASLAEATAHLDKAGSDLRAAAAHVEVARFDSERADAMAGYTKIEAPYDGVVIRRKIETGQLTTPGTSGEPLFIVARTDVVTISVGVPENDAPFVNAGDLAHVRVLALDGKVLEGKITRTAWALDAATRTLLAEIDLPNRDGILRPGLYAYATIDVDEHRDALTIPSTAVIKDAGTASCMTVVGDRAKRKAIRVGLNDGKRTEVLSGLEGTETVVEANAGSLADGQLVETTVAAGEPAKPKS